MILFTLVDRRFSLFTRVTYVIKTRTNASGRLQIRPSSIISNSCKTHTYVSLTELSNAEQMSCGTTRNTCYFMFSTVSCNPKPQHCAESISLFYTPQYGVQGVFRMRIKMADKWCLCPIICTHIQKQMLQCLTYLYLCSYSLSATVTAVQQTFFAQDIVLEQTSRNSIWKYLRRKHAISVQLTCQGELLNTHVHPLHFYLLISCVVKCAEVTLYALYRLHHVKGILAKAILYAQASLCCFSGKACGSRTIK